MKKLEEAMTFSNPTRQDIPNIHLYMDQLLEFYESTLGALKREGEVAVFTKTMINNYVKSGLVDPPIKKKYNSTAIEDLIIIYHLKKSFSIQDISIILESIKTNGHYYDHFVNDYNNIRDGLRETTAELSNDADCLRMLQQLIVEISFKKQLADTLIDQLKNNIPFFT